MIFLKVLLFSASFIGTLLASGDNDLSKSDMEPVFSQKIQINTIDHLNKGIHDLKQTIEKINEEASSFSLKNFFHKYLTKHNNTFDLGYTSLQTKDFEVGCFDVLSEIFPSLLKKDSLVQFLEKIQGPYTVQFFLNYINSFTEEVADEVAEILKKYPKFKIVFKTYDYQIKDISYKKLLDEGATFIQEQNVNDSFSQELYNYQNKMQSRTYKLEQEKSKIENKLMQLNLEKFRIETESFFKNDISTFNINSIPNRSKAEDQGWIPWKNLEVIDKNFINFDKISNVTFQNQPQFSIKEATLSPHHKEILKCLERKDIKGALLLFEKETGFSFEPLLYKLSSDSNTWKDVLLHVLTLMNTQEKDRGLVILEELARSLHHCSDAQASTLSSIRLSMQGVQSGNLSDILDYYTGYLKVKLAKERSDVFFQVTQETMEKILEKLKKEPKTLSMFEIDQLAHHIYQTFLKNTGQFPPSLEHKNTLFDSIRKELESITGSFFINILDDMRENPSFSHKLRDIVRSSWLGCYHEGRIGNDVGTPNEHLWPHDVTLAVMKNYFASHFLKEMQDIINPLLQTQQKKAIIEATTFDPNKVTLATQTPLDFSALRLALQLLKKEEAWADIVSPFTYRESLKNQTYKDLQGNQKILATGDLIEENFIKELHLDPNLFGKSEKIEDFHNGSVEAMLHHFGYLKKMTFGSVRPLDPIIQNQHRLNENTPLVHAFTDPSILCPNFWATLLNKRVLSYAPPQHPLMERHTIHFSWNELVKAHNLGTWEKYPYALIDLSQYFDKEMVGSNRMDTMIVGQHTLSHQAILVTPKEDNDGFNRVWSKKVHVHTYNPQKKTLRDAIQCAIKKYYPIQDQHTKRDIEFWDINLDHDGSVFDTLEKMFTLKDQEVLSLEEANRVVSALTSLNSYQDGRLERDQTEYLNKQQKIYWPIFGVKKVKINEQESIVFSKFYKNSAQF